MTDRLVFMGFEMDKTPPRQSDCIERWETVLDFSPPDPPAWIVVRFMKDGLVSALFRSSRLAASVGDIVERASTVDALERRLIEVLRSRKAGAERVIRMVDFALCNQEEPKL